MLQSWKYTYSEYAIEGQQTTPSHVLEDAATFKIHSCGLYTHNTIGYIEFGIYKSCSLSIEVSTL